MDEQRAKPKIHPLSFVGALVFALALVGVAYLVFRSQAEKAQPAQTTPQYLVTLLPAPTETPTLQPTTILPTPTLSDVSILPPDVIAVSRYVKVIGTQGLGLRMRAEAGTSSEVNFLATDNEAFKVIDGPIAKDGYTWWLCEALLDKTRSGWAAENYLQVLDLSTPQP
jgi:hypothetical protein